MNGLPVSSSPHCRQRMAFVPQYSRQYQPLRRHHKVAFVITSSFPARRLVRKHCWPSAENSLYGNSAKSVRAEGVRGVGEAPSRPPVRLNPTYSRLFHIKITMLISIKIGEPLYSSFQEFHQCKIEPLFVLETMFSTSLTQQRSCPKC